MKSNYLKVVFLLITTVVIIPLAASALSIETKEKSPHCPDKEIKFTVKGAGLYAQIYWSISSDAGEIVKANYGGNPKATTLPSSTWNVANADTIIIKWSKTQQKGLKREVYVTDLSDRNVNATAEYEIRYFEENTITYAPIVGGDRSFSSCSNYGLVELRIPQLSLDVHDNNKALTKYRWTLPSALEMPKAYNPNKDSSVVVVSIKSGEQFAKGDVKVKAIWQCPSQYAKEAEVTVGRNTGMLHVTPMQVANGGTITAEVANVLCNPTDRVTYKWLLPPGWTIEGQYVSFETSSPKVNVRATLTDRQKLAVQIKINGVALYTLESNTINMNEASVISSIPSCISGKSTLQFKNPANIPITWHVTGGFKVISSGNTNVVVQRNTASKSASTGTLTVSCQGKRSFEEQTVMSVPIKSCAMPIENLYYVGVKQSFTNDGSSDCANPVKYRNAKITVNGAVRYKGDNPLTMPETALGSMRYSTFVGRPTSANVECAIFKTDREDKTYTFDALSSGVNIRSISGSDKCYTSAHYAACWYTVGLALVVPPRGKRKYETTTSLTLDDPISLTNASNRTTLYANNDFIGLRLSSAFNSGKPAVL